MKETIICQKCPKPAAYRAESIEENPKVYILCTNHYADLCMYIAKNTAEFLLKGKAKQSL